MLVHLNIIAGLTRLFVDMWGFRKVTGKPERAAVVFRSPLFDEKEFVVASLNPVGSCWSWGLGGDGNGETASASWRIRGAAALSRRANTRLRNRKAVVVRIAESGVLTLYAVSIKNQPASIRIFETYADEVAYKAHLETPHFKRYKTTTKGMVKSLRLIETEPIMLGTRSR